MIYTKSQYFGFIRKCNATKPLDSHVNHISAVESNDQTKCSTFRTTVFRADKERKLHILKSSTCGQ